MKLKKLAVVLGVAGALAASSYAWAATVYFTETVYYSDATHMYQVGEKLNNCKNVVTVHGTITQFPEIVTKYNCAYPFP